MSSPTDVPTALLVHGAWHGAWCWEDHFVPGLTEAGFDARAANLPGHGRSGNTRRIWNTLGGYVEAVRQQIAEIDGPVVLIGHSMGGLVTQRVIETTPIAGAILMASVPIDGAMGATVRTVSTDPMGFMRTITLTMWPIVSDRDRVRARLFSNTTEESVVAATADRLQNESYLAYLSMMFRRPRPGQSGTPVLVVSASEDGIFNQAEQDATAHAHRADHVVIEGSGHNLMLDDKWPEALEACVEFIRGLSILESTA